MIYTWVIYAIILIAIVLVAFFIGRTIVRLVSKRNKTFKRKDANHENI